MNSLRILYVRFFRINFFFNVDFKFFSKYIHFEVIVLINFVEIYFETLNIIDCKRFLCQVLYNSFKCDNFVDNFKHDTNFSFEIVILKKISTKSRS